MSGLFSEREGYVTQYIQYEFINKSLRKKIYLWLIYYLLEKSQVHSKANLETIYIHFFDLVPMEYPDSPKDFLLAFCLDGIWHRLYSLIEFIYSRMGAAEKKLKHEMDGNINLILERNRSAYRLIDGIIAGIINKEEVDEIEKTVEETMPCTTYIK